MTTGLNYGNHEGDVYTSYLGRAHRGGARPGHRPRLLAGSANGRRLHADDTWSPDGDLEVTNETGLAQIQWGWGLLKTEQLNDLPPAPPGEPLVSVQHGVCVDVPGFSTTAGTALGLWYCNGGGNSPSTGRPRSSSPIYGDMCVTAGGALVAGDQLVIADCDGTREQQWELRATPRSAVSQAPDLCLGDTRRTVGRDARDVRRDRRDQQWTRG